MPAHRLARTLAQVGGRAGDFAARYGGEEFAVVLADTDLAGAQAFAARVLAAIRKLAIPHPRRADRIVSVSVGIASMVPSPDMLPSGLLAAADAALYRAKNGGRDCAAV